MPRVRVRDNKAEFVLSPAMFSGHGHDVTITRSDVNEIQLAKSAIRVGIDVLLAECGVTADDDRRIHRGGRVWHLPRSQQRHPHRHVSRFAA